MSLKFHLFHCLIQQVFNCDMAAIKQGAHEEVTATIFNIFIHNIDDFFLHSARLTVEKII